MVQGNFFWCRSVIIIIIISMVGRKIIYCNRISSVVLAGIYFHRYWSAWSAIRQRLLGALLLGTWRSTWRTDDFRQVCNVGPFVRYHNKVSVSMHLYFFFLEKCLTVDTMLSKGYKCVFTLYANYELVLGNCLHSSRSLTFKDISKRF